MNYNQKQELVMQFCSDEVEYIEYCVNAYLHVCFNNAPCFVVKKVRSQVPSKIRITPKHVVYKACKSMWDIVEEEEAHPWQVSSGYVESERLVAARATYGQELRKVAVKYCYAQIAPDKCAEQNELPVGFEVTV